MRRLKGKRRKVVRRRKSIFTNFYFSFSVFASIIVLSAVGFFLFSPRFQIQSLSISGNNNIPTEELEKVAGEKAKTSFSLLGFDVSTASIFLFGKSGTDVLMEKFPEIEKVVVKKNFPDGITLEIVEKTPFAVWTDVFDNSKKYLVDEKGSFVKNYEDKEEYSSLIRVNQKEKIKDLDKKDALSKLSLITKELKDNSLIVYSFDMFEEKVSVNSNVNCLIIFNINEDLDWQIEKLGIVLKNSKYSSGLNRLKYIDLRFGNQAIIK
jgi:cell division septal protein FtsQ